MRFRWRLISHFPALWPVHDPFDTVDFSIFSDGIKSWNRPSTIHSQYKFLKDRCCCLVSIFKLCVLTAGMCRCFSGQWFFSDFHFVLYPWASLRNRHISSDWIVLNLPAAARLVFTLLFSFNVCTLSLNPQLLRARAVMVLKTCLCFSSTNAPRGKVIDRPLDVALSLVTVCECRGLGPLHHRGEAETVWWMLHRDLEICCFHLHISRSSKLYLSCRAFPPTELSTAPYFVISLPFSIKTLPPTA